MANENIGVVICAHCGRDADIREYKNGKKKYYVCKNCGMITPNAVGGQAWLEKCGTFFNTPEKAGEAKETIILKPKEKPEKAKAKKKDSFEKWVDGLGDDEQEQSKPKKEKTFLQSLWDGEE